MTKDEELPKREDVVKVDGMEEETTHCPEQLDTSSAESENTPTSSDDRQLTDIISQCETDISKEIPKDADSIVDETLEHSTKVIRSENLIESTSTDENKTCWKENETSIAEATNLDLPDVVVETPGDGFVTEVDQVEKDFNKETEDMTNGPKGISDNTTEDSPIKETLPSSPLSPELMFGDSAEEVMDTKEQNESPCEVKTEFSGMCFAKTLSETAVITMPVDQSEGGSSVIKADQPEQAANMETEDTITCPTRSLLENPTEESAVEDLTPDLIVMDSKEQVPNTEEQKESALDAKNDASESSPDLIVEDSAEGGSNMQMKKEPLCDVKMDCPNSCITKTFPEKEVSESLCAMTKDTATSVSAVPSLKGIAAKYPCVGSAQKVSVPTSKGLQNGKTITIPKFESRKRTEKFIVRNVSKVSKIYKVSNLSYKIKPVLKNTTAVNCPIIYVGEPAFVDLEDFTDVQNELTKDYKEEGTTDMKKSSKEVPKRNSLLLSDIPQSSMQWSSPYSFPDTLRHSENAVPEKKPSEDIADIKNLFPSEKLLSSAKWNPSHPFPYRSSASERVVPASNTVSTVNAVPHNNQNNPAFRIVARQVPRSVISESSKITPTIKEVTTGKPQPAPIIPKRSHSIDLTTSKVVNLAPIRSISSPTAATIPQKPTISSPPGKNQTGHDVANVKFILPKQGQVAVPVTLNFVSNSKTAVVAKVSEPPKLTAQNSNKLIVVDSRFRNTQWKAGLTTVVDAVNRPIIFQHVNSTIATKPATKTVTSTNSTKPVTKTVAAANKTKTNFTQNLNTEASPSMRTKPSYLEQHGLRAGVEVTFEDGVRHFISKLSRMTHLDDEPIHSWDELKKGMKVAAAWTDGQVYDATVVGCYFPNNKHDKRPASTNKQMQPVVSLESLPAKVTREKSVKCNEVIKQKPKPEKITKSKHVGCTRCRVVFSTIVDFREHQRLCKSTGIVVPHGTSKITDAMVAGVMKDTTAKKKHDTEKDTIAKKKHGTEKDAIAKKKHDTEKTPTKTQPPPPSNSTSTKRPGPKISRSPPRKRTRTANESAKLELQDSGDAIFKKGTKFLHRWQLDGGGIKWYQGEVIRIVTNSGAFLNWEFEVSYKGETDNYVLKLYEDFPSDIRIIGTM